MLNYYIFAEINFGFLRQRHQIFADLLKEEFNVHFFERVPSRVPDKLAKRVWRRFGPREVKSTSRSFSEHEGINVRPSYMAPSTNLLFNAYNEKRVNWLLRDAKPGDIVHLFANSPSVTKVARTKQCIVVFDIVHNWWNFPYHNFIQRRNIEEVLGRSDLVVSDSAQTLSMAKQGCSDRDKEFLLLPPGVNEIWFSNRMKNSYQETNEFKVAFFGNLRANSDLELFRELSSIERTNIEIFGLLDQSLPSDDYEWLRKFYDGNYNVSDLVNKLETADAIMLPYDRSAFSSSIFPAKYFEAMALGKPIISNSQMAHLPMWNKFIWTSDEVKRLGWESLCRQHYEYRCPQQVKFARENSWNGRVQTLKESICSVL